MERAGPEDDEREEDDDCKPSLLGSHQDDSGDGIGDSGILSLG
jgi:hypothetical protein